jgi:hypothetical protein
MAQQKMLPILPKSSNSVANLSSLLKKSSIEDAELAHRVKFGHDTQEN